MVSYPFFIQVCPHQHCSGVHFFTLSSSTDLKNLDIYVQEQDRKYLCNDANSQYLILFALFIMTSLLMCSQHMCCTSFKYYTVCNFRFFCLFVCLFSYKISWHNIYCSKYGYIYLFKLQFPLGMSSCIYINALVTAKSKIYLREFLLLQNKSKCKKNLFFWYFRISVCI